MQSQKKKIPMAMEDKFSYSSNIVMRKKNISSYFFNESVQDIYQDFSILARKEL